MSEGNEHSSLKPGQIAPAVSLDDFLPYLINRIANRLNMSLHQDLRCLSVGIPEYRVLAVLMAGDGRSVNELAVYTVTGQSTLSKSLARMEQAGFIERRPDPADGRGVKVHITAHGICRFQQIVPFALKHYRHALEGFNEAERRELTRLLHRVLDNIRESAFP